MIKLGFSRVDLSPSLTPQRPIKDPVEAIALFILSDEKSVVWITLDFMDFNKKITDTLRMSVTSEVGLPPENIHILTTHNHGAGTPELGILLSLTARVARSAMEAAEPVLMRYAFCRTDRQVNIKRRLFIPEIDGVATLYYGASEKNNLDTAHFSENVIKCIGEGRETNYVGEGFSDSGVKFPEGDSEICIVQFVSLTGECVGSIVRFAAHAVCCNLPEHYSSDYPHYVRACVEEKLGGVCMFLNGPCADIAPVMRDKREGRERVLGRYIADMALNALIGAELRPLESFSCAKREVKLPVREELLRGMEKSLGDMPNTLGERRKYLERLRLSNTIPFLTEKYSEGESSVSDLISVYLGFLRLGDLIFAAYPGETFSSTAASLKERIPEYPICTVTEHERTVMYLPPRDDCEMGGYESVCRVTSPDAEHILREAMISFVCEELK